MEYIHIGPFLCKPFTKPQGEKISHFIGTHESCRKDVKRVFGMMQAHFHMILEDENNEDFKIFESSKDIQIRCKLYFVNIKQGT
jgi:hypothetical protein